MDLAFDLLQGAGIAAAVGIRPLLPILLVGALASVDAGLDFEGTDYRFLEQTFFLFGIVVLVAVADVVRRAAGDDRFEAGVGLAVTIAVSIVLAALAAAASMADRDHPVVLGLVAGVAAAALGLAASRSLFARVRGRLDADAAGLLPLYREGIALAAAGLSILFPPLALVILGVLGWLLLRGRQRAGEKYAGLRILR